MDDEVLHRDVHPAEVLMPDGSIIKTARIFASQYRVLVYVSEQPRRDIKLVAELVLANEGTIPASAEGLAGRLEARTSDGTAWINRARGCGCKTPELAALEAPWPRTRRSRQR